MIHLTYIHKQLKKLVQGMKKPGVLHANPISGEN